MRNVLRLATLIAFLMIVIPGALAQNPNTLPNPNVYNPDNYVYDGGRLLNDKTVKEINAECARARKETTCEVAVAVVEDLDGLSIEDYAYTLFKNWGLGKKDKNNGVLLLVVPSENKARIEVGSGVEGVLTDVACFNILRYNMTPLAEEGNISQGIYRTVVAVSRALRKPAAAAELRSRHADSMMSRFKVLDRAVFFTFFKIVVACVFCFTLILFLVDFISTRNRRNYRRAMTWKAHLGTYLWGAILSLGTAAPIALLAWLLYRHARDVTEICDTCGAKMKKLSEKDDNAYLTPSQDFEEKIGSVDYDVWLCPECGTVERFPYVEKQLKYHECPECHTIAMNLAMDKVIEPPTTKKEGIGERAYQCQFCGHIKREHYRIPRKTDDSALIAGAVLGAAIGSMGRGGNSGGSGFGGGGGFGGGSSSGGGANGSW